MIRFDCTFACTRTALQYHMNLSCFAYFHIPPSFTHYIAALFHLVLLSHTSSISLITSCRYPSNTSTTMISVKYVWIDVLYSYGGDLFTAVLLRRARKLVQSIYCQNTSILFGNNLVAAVYLFSGMWVYVVQNREESRELLGCRRRGRGRHRVNQL